MSGIDPDSLGATTPRSASLPSSSPYPVAGAIRHRCCHRMALARPAIVTADQTAAKLG